MTEQSNFPPKKTRTRQVFVFGISVTAGILALALLIGPLMVGAGADPRGIMAVTPVFTGAVMVVVIGWLGWMMLRRR